MSTSVDNSYHNNYHATTLYNADDVTRVEECGVKQLQDCTIMYTYGSQSAIKSRLSRQGTLPHVRRV